MRQRNLFDPADPLEEAFLRFHRDHPHVWETFERMALQMAAVRDHYSARTIIAVMRWHTDLQTDQADGFKINDHHSPFYARMFHAEHPHLDGFFRNRVRAAEQ